MTPFTAVFQYQNTEYRRFLTSPESAVLGGSTVSTLSVILIVALILYNLPSFSSDKQWAERNRVKDPEDDNKITDKMLRTMKTNMVKKKNEYLIAKTEFEKAAETQQLQIRAQTRKKEVLKGKDKNISSDHANNIVAAGSDDFLPEKNISADTVKSPSKVLVTDPS